MSVEVDLGNVLPLDIPLRLPSVRQHDRTLADPATQTRINPRVVRDSGYNDFLCVWADVGMVRVADVYLDPAEVCTQLRAVIRYETPEGIARETLFPMRWEERSWAQVAPAVANLRTRFTAKISTQLATTWIRPTLYGIAVIAYESLVGPPDESVIIYDVGHSVGPLPGSNSYEGRVHRVLDVSAVTRHLLTREPRTKQVGITATDALGVYWVGDRSVAIGRGARLTGANVMYSNDGAPLYIVVETKPADDTLQIAEVFQV
jgi:hypothetical protein